MNRLPLNLSRPCPGWSPMARTAALALLAGLLAAPAATLAGALPEGGTITAGSGSIATAGNTMTITQQSGRMAADWTSFSIGRDNTVNFIQPSASAAALNRVTGAEASLIQGALNANGQVFLVNPNGVLFSPTSRVEVGGLVASTLALATDDFMAGRLTFSGASANAVVNQGTLAAAPGGTVALIAARIENSGSITAEQGAVLLGAGRTVTLDLGGAVKLQVEEGAIDALIAQGGALRADGGLIYLTARAAGELAGTVINHTGLSEARTLASGAQGEIYLLGDMDNDRIAVAGTLDASAPSGGDGGFIETSAAAVGIADGLRVTSAAPQGRTGEWLIDPTTNFTIAATGGDMSGAVLSGSLATTAVTISSADGATAGSGDILVNDAVTWSSGTTLTLSAARNIAINAAIDASGGSGGKLALEYGQGAAAAGNTAVYTVRAPVSLLAGENFSTRLGSDGTTIDYTVITALGAAESVTGTDLQGIDGNLSGHYALGADIDAAATGGWRDGGSSPPLGFSPLGFWSVGPHLYGTGFTGTFDGLGHTITGLTMNLGGLGPVAPVGLFSAVSGGTVRNLGMENVTIKGAVYVGGLAGYNNAGSISNCYVIGDVSGSGGTGGLIGKNSGVEARVRDSYFVGTVTGDGYDVGGLVGRNDDGSISDDYALASVSGYEAVGGLVGNSILGSVSNSYATGGVTGGAYVGGLVGWLEASTVSSSYAKGSVDGTGFVGGLVGANSPGSSVSASYATGSVSGTSAVGGLVGNNSNQSAISDCYATGSVTGDSIVGGLVGQNNVQSTVSNSYTTGSVDGNYYVGGLVGTNNDRSVISNSYATGRVTGRVTGETSVGGLVGLNDFGATVATSYWDIDATGRATSAGGGTGIRSSTGTVNAYTQGTYEGFDFGTDWFMIPGETRPFLRMEHSTTIGNLHQLQLMAMDPTAAYTLATDLDFTGILNDPAQMWRTAAGFVPVGSATTPFAGSFAGQGHTISNLVIRRPTTDDVGLFGHTSAAVIDGLGLVGGDIQGRNYVGGLVGESVGYSAISNSYMTGSVTGGTAVGGLVGWNYAGSTVSNSYATGSVSGTDEVGGLVGVVGLSSAVSNCYATGSVSGTNNYVGGLVGLNTNVSTVSNSYATGNVSGTNNYVGGLVGASNDGYVSDCYATGSVNGKSSVGGLVGANAGTSFVKTSYATGKVTGSTSVGGLVGSAASNGVFASYWDSESTGQTASAGAFDALTAGKTTLQMQLPSTYQGWDTSVWSLAPGQAVEGYGISRPYLTDVTRAADRPAQTLLFAGGWGGLSGAGQPGADGTPYAIADWNQLANINLVTWKGYDFALANDLTAATGGYASQVKDGAVLANNGAGWRPIGSGEIDLLVLMEILTSGVSGTFGTFDGLGHTISGLVINRPEEDNVGLFGSLIQAEIKNLTLADVSVVGRDYVGGLVGGAPFHTGMLPYNELRGAWDASNVSIGGSVSGRSYVGGLGGAMGGQTGSLGLVTDSSATVSVSGSGSYVGGLAGYSFGGTVSNSNATGNVVGSGSYVGGLAGYSYGYVNDSYATGNVTGSGSSVGGLAGYSYGYVVASYATGNVTGSGDGIGGLLGKNEVGSVSNSYASGEVNGSGEGVGGLIGINGNMMGTDYAAEVIDSHATGSVTGKKGLVGGLVGVNLQGSVSGSYATGDVNGSGDYVGGLVGSNYMSSVVSDSYASGAVFGKGSYTGGLAGGNMGGRITGSSASGAVTGQDYVGGLAGYNYMMGLVSDSFAIGEVDGAGNYVGGLVGESTYAGTVSGSYASGKVDGEGSYIGGLVGSNSVYSTVTDSYATGAVTGGDYVGGLVGANQNGEPNGTMEGFANRVSTSYALGKVSGPGANVGGLLGGNDAQSSVSDSYWDTETSGQLSSAGGTGKTTAEMQQASTFVGWDLRASGDSDPSTTETWRIYEGQTSPLLVSFLTPVTATVTADPATYSGKAFAGPLSYRVPEGTEPARIFGTLQPTSTAINAGIYAVDGLYSDQSGYDISIDGTLTINPAALTVTANDGGKTYDGLGYRGGNGVSYSGFVNGESAGVLDGTLAYGGSSQGAVNAGSYVITPSGLSSGNYTLTFIDGTLTISPAALTVTANDGGKTYDGLGYRGGNGVSYSGFVNGESAGVLDGTLAYGGSSQGAVNAGSYVITPSGLSSGNYTLTFIDGTLTISPRPLTVTADDQEKKYGAQDPELSWAVSAGNLVGTDRLTGSLVRAAGEKAGSYPITRGMLAADSNYLLTFIDGTLVIAPLGAPACAAQTSGEQEIDGGRPELRDNGQPPLQVAGTGINYPPQVFAGENE